MCDEKLLLKTALTAALGQKEASESQAAQLASERSELLRERTNLQHQVDFAAGCQAQAEQAAAAAQAQLAQLRAELEASRQEAQDKESRLAQLEGGAHTLMMEATMPRACVFHCLGTCACTSHEPRTPRPVTAAGEFGALKEVLGETAAAAGDGSKDVVAALLSKIGTLQSAVAAAEAMRRKLHNELVDLRGNVSGLQQLWLWLVVVLGTQVQSAAHPTCGS